MTESAGKGLIGKGPQGLPKVRTACEAVAQCIEAEGYGCVDLTSFRRPFLKENQWRILTLVDARFIFQHFSESWNLRALEAKPLTSTRSDWKLSCWLAVSLFSLQQPFGNSE